MKKLLLITATLITLSATAAQAQINIELGGRPDYIQPQPLIVEHPYLPAHYNGRDRHHEGRDWREVHEHHDEVIHHDDRRR